MNIFRIGFVYFCKNSLVFIGSKSSTLKAIYVERNALVEKWSKIGHFALMELSIPGITMPFTSAIFHISPPISATIHFNLFIGN